MRTLSPEWTAAMTSGAKPIYSVELEIGPLAWLTVRDYTVGAGESFSIYADGVLVQTFTEGVDFTAGISNADTALSIYNAAFSVLGTGIVLRAVKSGTRVGWVDLVFPLAIDNVTVVSSNSAAWSATPGHVPRIVGFVSGDSSVEGYSASIAAVESLAMMIDPVSRAFSVGQVEIVFHDDGAIRTLLSRSFPRGRGLTIKLGCEGLTLSQYESLGKFVITDYRPAAGQITIDCEEPSSRLTDSKVTGRLMDVHPYSALIWLLDQANIAAEYRDDASLDSTTDTAVSHWSLSRHDFLPRLVGRSELGSNALGEPTSAKELFDSLLILIQGSYVGNEDGTYSFRRLDTTTSPVRALTLDDIDDVEYRGMTENLVTGVDVTGFEDGESSERTHLFSITDETSETVHTNAALVASSTYRRTIESDWLGMWGRLLETINTTDLEILVQFPVIAGFSGTRPSAALPALTQRTADTLTEDRPAYYLLSDGSQVEIIEVVAHTPLNNQWFNVAGVFMDPALSGGNPTVPGWGRFTIKRGKYGTVAEDWTYGRGSGVFVPGEVRVYDVTLAVHAATTILSRFSMGAPIAKVRTSLRHLDLQLGDFVTFDDDVFIHFGSDGADSTVVWEIISKEVMALDDSPGIVFTLAWVRDDSSPTTVLVGAPPIAVSFPVTFDDALTTDAGEIITDDNGLTIYRG